jgi:hypothetical protein
MRPEEFEDAKLLWKMFYAGQSFEHARAAAEYVLKENISADNAIFYPLMTAVYVLYGKPFRKSHGVGCLDEKLIPLKYQELHQDLMKHRDKILAHSDASGFEWFDVGQANQVRLVVRSSTDKSFLVCGQLQANPALLPHIISLCLELQELVESKKRELFKRYEKYVPAGVGEYILNIEDPSGDFFGPAKPVVEIK